ncbi:ribosomal RNA small subunit methyltransferase B [gamma proteobacterium HTCC5015]|nr:ribosomal RNA small subunit methyltransferase B [gamma proteobacterium HTCC5015]
MNARQQALRAITSVQQGQSLSAALPDLLAPLPKRDRGLCQELSYGSLRYYHRYEWLSQQLLKKPFKHKDSDLQAVLALGLYQLFEMRIPDHAAVSNTVALVNGLKKSWAKGVINAVLRNALRQRDEWRGKIADEEAAQHSLPRWLLNFLEGNWPDQWTGIAEASLAKPPMTLRISGGARDQYRQRLSALDIECHAPERADWALTITPPVDTDVLPGFAKGEASVQDAAAQWAAPLLNPQAGERVLDACAAPGGKTGHMLEWASALDLVALDLEPKRLARVEQNLTRLGRSAELLSADLRDTARWWNGQAFDRILLDAPCSASGVIRRHPDIKLLRQPEDINALVELQAQCLDAAWSTLKEGGTLLYATCSLFKAENQHQVREFLERHSDAALDAFSETALPGIDTGYGQQFFPGGPFNGDGFFYARLRKRP